MRRFAHRVLVALRLRTAPAVPPLAPVRRGREISAGTAFLGAPATPLAKLSPVEAERLLGIPVRVIGR